MRRRWIVALAVLAWMGLPWLFIGEGPRNAQQAQAPGWDLGGFLPAPAPEAAPLPRTAPLALQYWPVPEAAAQAWIRRHYPGALAGEPIGAPVVAAALAAGRRYNLNPLLLLGILAAEQGFLSPNVPGGLAHAELFLQNPWDYGVWPGSPFRFAIGAQASALGAAALVDRVAQAVLRRGWSWGAFEADLARTYVGAPSADWVRNTFGTWAAMAADPAIQSGALLAVLANPASGPPTVAEAVTQALGGAAAQAGAAVTALAADAQQGAQWLGAHAQGVLERAGVPAAVAAGVGAAVAVAAQLLELAPAVAL